MAIQYLSANRFGLGRRHDDPEEMADVRGDLLRQLDKFDPAPALIAGQPSRAAIARAYITYYAEREQLRRDIKAKRRGGDKNAAADTSVLRAALHATRMP